MVVVPYKETKKRKTSPKKKVHFETSATSDDEVDCVIITEPRNRLPSPMVIILYKESSTSTVSTQKPNGRKRHQTCFLGLPCEIRQAILLQVQPSHQIWSSKKELIRKRANILGKVHPRVEGDIIFVEVQWKTEAYEARNGGEVGSGLFRGEIASWRTEDGRKRIMFQVGVFSDEEE